LPGLSAKDSAVARGIADGPMLRSVLASCLLGVLATGLASAQDQTPPSSESSPQAPAGSFAGLDTAKLPELCRAAKQSVADKHIIYSGGADCVLPDNGRVFAESIDIVTDDEGTHIVAEGNVVFTGADGHIDAERLEYNTGTGTGTFTIAHGFLTLGPNVDRRQWGGQMPEVEFWGNRLEKLGPKRFRITTGGWTTCNQPTPRWDFTSTSMDLMLDERVIAKNTVLRVKGVPLFYLPYIYYPIKDEDRSTGFLMPTYGTSTFRGQAISNAFFWAIDRSQDATFFHDWFTRAGQGEGAEYRYVASTQSSGTFRFYRFATSSTALTDNGTTATVPATSYEVTGNAVQTIRPWLTARVRADYFTDVVNQQLLHQTLYEASRSNRLIEGGLTGTRGPWSGNLLFQRNEVLNGIDDSVVYGSAPRLTATLAPQRLFSSPVYASFNTDLGYLPYQHVVDGRIQQDNSFGRFDASPSIRVPFSKLSFLSINTSAAYRTTYYTRHASDTPGQTEAGSFLRQYATVRTDVVGPVVSRIFDLQDNPFAERIKHVIEPAVSVDLTSPISDFRETPLQSDVSDFVVGGATRVTYGVTSRLFYRKPTVNKVRGETREFLTVGLQQTSYSNSEASRFDSTYSSTVTSIAGQTLSPVALTARVSPSGRFDGNMRAEYDVSHGLGLQSLTSGASVNYANGGVTLNYSRQRFGPDPSLPQHSADVFPVPRSDVPAPAAGVALTKPVNSFLSASVRAQAAQNRINGTYSLSWDIARGYVVSQGVVASYMAQCCGVQAEFQQFNYPVGFPISADRRINFAFVLAGLGTFSNFFGAFGGR
jgi:LPS-assembly protein